VRGRDHGRHRQIPPEYRGRCHTRGTALESVESVDCGPRRTAGFQRGTRGLNVPVSRAPLIPPDVPASLRGTVRRSIRRRGIVEYCVQDEPDDRDEGQEDPGEACRPGAPLLYPDLRHGDDRYDLERTQENERGLVRQGDGQGGATDVPMARQGGSQGVDLNHGPQSSRSPLCSRSVQVVRRTEGAEWETSRRARAES